MYNKIFVVTYKKVLVLQYLAPKLYLFMVLLLSFNQERRILLKFYCLP